MLLVNVELRKQDALLRALEVVKSQQDDPQPVQETPKPQSSPPPSESVDSDPSALEHHPGSESSHSEQGLSPGECARILQELCPLCFGGNRFGRSVEEYVDLLTLHSCQLLTHCDSGADIHVSIDGNFNHRHARAAGDCPEFHTPRHLLSKEEVDGRGAQIEKARAAGKSAKKKRSNPTLDEAIDACEEAHESGSGSKIKTNLDKFDHGGVMGMTCRHDRPLFLANIDTPGEQQKYGVALIEHLFQYLPRHATVIVAYDVGCVCDRSRQLVSLRFVSRHVFTNLRSPSTISILLEYPSGLGL
jgi:Kyakuja-Dileera-Zisupton transposase